MTASAGRERVSYPADALFFGENNRDETYICRTYRDQPGSGWPVDGPGSAGGQHQQNQAGPSVALTPPTAEPPTPTPLPLTPIPPTAIPPTDTPVATAAPPAQSTATPTPAVVEPTATPLPPETLPETGGNPPQNGGILWLVLTSCAVLLAGLFLRRPHRA
jgi:hypothetical protein